MVSTRAWWTSLPISLGGDESAGWGVAAGDVGGAVAGVEDLVDGGFDGVGVLLEVGGVAQDHGGGEDGSEGVGLAGAGDVGRGAVDGLVEVDLCRRWWRRGACRGSR